MSEADNQHIVEALAEELEPYNDYWPIDQFYESYEQYCRGLTDEPPSIAELDASGHSAARMNATFLDWKYAKGLEEATDRDMSTFLQLNEFLLHIEKPHEFISWLGSFATDA